jgi:hypothetical protein
VLKEIRSGQRGHATDAPVLAAGAIAHRGVFHEELYTMSDVVLTRFQAALGKVAGQLFFWRRYSQLTSVDMMCV